MNRITRGFALVAPLALAALVGCARNQDGDDAADQTEFGNEPMAIVHGRGVKDQDQLGRTVVALIEKRADSEALCTGTIIADDTVLTAAHCVDEGIQELAIVFAARVRGAPGENIRPANGFVQNPRWKKPTANGRGDLALVHFDGGLPDGYSAARLAPKSSTIAAGESVVMIGYGVTDGLKHSGAGVLRQTETEIIGQQSKTEFITDGQKSSVCFGDSGGPAFVRSASGEYLQIGVASSVANQECNKTSIHTMVTPYLSWIKAAQKKFRGGGRKASRGRAGPKAGSRGHRQRGEFTDDAFDQST